MKENEKLRCEGANSLKFTNQVNSNLNDELENSKNMNSANSENSGSIASVSLSSNDRTPLGPKSLLTQTSTIMTSILQPEPTAGSRQIL